MTNKKISLDDFIGDESTELVQPKNQKETTTMKTHQPFYKKTITIIIVTIVVTLLAVFGAYKLYEFVFNQGVQHEQHRQSMIDEAVAARSKKTQQ